MAVDLCCRCRGVTHGDADLTDAAQTLLDQTLVTGMKRFIASEEQRRGLLRIERGAQQPDEARLCQAMARPNRDGTRRTRAMFPSSRRRQFGLRDSIVANSNPE